MLTVYRKEQKRRKHPFRNFLLSATVSDSMRNVYIVTSPKDEITEQNAYYSKRVQDFALI